MATLVLVRHGQASFLGDDYDVLSDLGMGQARKLGEHWARTGVRFDVAFTGPLKRQRGTAEIAAAAHREAGLPFPSIQVLPEWEEYAGEAVIRQSLPRMASERPDLSRLLNTGSRAADPGEIRKRFQKAFEVVMKEWVRGELDTDGIESWQEFKARIARGLEIATASSASGQRTVVFTSGGATAAAMQRVLGTSDEVAIELSWMVKNGALTEFLYGRERMTLAGFNLTPHLEGPEWISYR